MGSGHAGLVVECRPDLVPSAAGFLAAQRDYAGGSVGVPAHPGLFEALADDGFAAGFDGAGSDEVAELAEVRVTHPVGVGLEVAERLIHRVGRRVGEGEGAGGTSAVMSPRSSSVSRSVNQPWAPSPGAGEGWHALKR